MSKGGFTGFGALATPIVALALPPVVAAGVLLPILIAQDAVSVWAFRHEWDRWIVAWMLPGAIVGIAFAWLFARTVDGTLLAALIGALSVLFAARRLWAGRGQRLLEPSRSPGWVGLLFGVLTGFTSQVAHAGGPPFQMWVTPRQLPHTRYVGTNAVLFAVINWLKVPAFVTLGALTPKVLLTSAALLPVAMVSTYASLHLVRRMPGERFYTLIYWLMFGLGLYLVTRAL
ncbi:sulfite exporter TauE/SafE family protein [Novosphingobium piscinae]|nr:sulfite exporter TauE/SafE family protein [Novosphingobium piscinae]